MNDPWESLIDAARDLDRGDDVEVILADLLRRFDCGASDPAGNAVAELLRALLAAWPDDEEDNLWAVGEGDDDV